MKQSNQLLITKFEKLTRWMIEDTERSIYKAKANFLVALGLLNYTEILGSFVTGSKTNPGNNFDIFFERLGPEYQQLISRFNNKRKNHPHIIYDDLRCGLTHEYAVKRKLFTVYGVDVDIPPTAEQIKQLKINVNGKETTCEIGILHIWNDTKHSSGTWHIINPVYHLDFRNAVARYIVDIKDESNKLLRKNFFKRAGEINLVNFS